MTAHDPACLTYRLQLTILAKLGQFRAWMDERDQLVMDALEAGVSKTDIHKASGLARTTIDAIAAGKY